MHGPSTTFVVVTTLRDGSGQRDGSIRRGRSRSATCTFAGLLVANKVLPSSLCGEAAESIAESFATRAPAIAALVGRGRGAGLRCPTLPNWRACSRRSVAVS